MARTSGQQRQQLALVRRVVHDRGLFLFWCAARGGGLRGDSRRRLARGVRRARVAL
jgi:hypothetical protein